VIALPIGNFLAGAVADRFGSPAAQGGYAVSALCMMWVIVALFPRLRRLD
jgi:hypothetical protein